jgi:hypothetical protein
MIQNVFVRILLRATVSVEIYINSTGHFGIVKKHLALRKHNAINFGYVKFVKSGKNVVQ